MFYWLAEFSDGGGVLNLFRYITVRAGGAFVTALVFGFLFGRPLIDLLRRKQGKGQPIRDDGPQSHLSKAGTPTMGGLLILSALMVSTLLWARLDNPFVWIVILVTLAFGLIGFADDYAKVTKQNTKGVSGRVRMGLGLLIAALAAYAASMFHPPELTNQLAQGLLDAARDAGIPLVVNNVGGMFGIFFTDAPTVTCYQDVVKCDVERFKRFFHLMLEEGVYLAPSAFEAGFMSIAHSEEDIDNTVAAARNAFAKL